MSGVLVQLPFVKRRTCRDRFLLRDVMNQVFTMLVWNANPPSVVWYGNEMSSSLLAECFFFVVFSQT